ncbi:MAG: hypothetical protein Kow00109_30120 [Acidobacteriota bacterium]
METSRFQLFGPAHLVTLATLLLLTLLLLRGASALPRGRRDKLANCVGWAAVANGIVWRLILAALGDFNLETDLPIHAFAASAPLRWVWRSSCAACFSTTWRLTGSLPALRWLS